LVTVKAGVNRSEYASGSEATDDLPASWRAKRAWSIDGH
jgi:hypothetical protein